MTQAEETVICLLVETPENVATFGMGWFFIQQNKFFELKPQLDTQEVSQFCINEKFVCLTKNDCVAGTIKFPHYGKMGDHTEAVQVKFNPEIVTFEQLLTVFFEEHEYNVKEESRQYRSVVWYQNEKQKAATEAKIAEIEKNKKCQVYSTVEPLGDFYKAEEFHQKYCIKQKEKGEK
ncbi:hypothetical protein RFI_20891 [Reticulomyxa filosa]|uniref:peptide-methionine (S)-S-oxide reductase n=1 Tax=Reticulomyxa filosa TaxID=46433 RepID=X6MR36_RETFI|nr:hypothetical protein RFI_20891 [Reticulomyxa filosa]|eukprot:ETO16448.1 hypothetical protein RFI_20891 [Reticulomyxa filosa]